MRAWSDHSQLCICSIQRLHVSTEPSEPTFIRVTHRNISLSDFLKYNAEQVSNTDKINAKDHRRHPT